MSKFTFSVWSDYGNPLNSSHVFLIRADADWHFSESAKFIELTFGLLGFSVSVTYWPDGVPE
jgi:hypothetical protein